MERLAGELEKLLKANSGAAAASAQALANSSKACEVCRLVKNVEKSFVRHLTDFIQTERGRKAYTASQGLCLRHLDMLSSSASSAPIRRFLLAQAARRFAEIAEDMQNYAIKRDAREGYTLNQDEKDAWWRGLVHSVGDKQVSVGWDEDIEL